MDKFINNKSGKVVLKINDDGSQEVDEKYFKDVKDGTIKLQQTSEEDGHAHGFTVDSNGDGSTTTNDGHKHKIIAYEIIPQKDGHSHALPLGVKSLPGE